MAGSAIRTAGKISLKMAILAFEVTVILIRYQAGHGVVEIRPPIYMASVTISRWRNKVCGRAMTIAAQQLPVIFLQLPAIGPFMMACRSLTGTMAEPAVGLLVTAKTGYSPVDAG